MKKRFITIGVIVAAVIGIASIGHQPSQANLNVSQTPSQTAPIEDTATPVPAQPKEPAQSEPSSASNSNNLSNDNTYTNADGNTVRSPAYSTDDSVPDDATAKCTDGTYSFSQNHRGTCSHHGGVAKWL